MRKQNSNMYAWVILLLASLAIFTSSYVQYQLSPIAGKIIEKFALNNSQFASLFSAPMIPAIFLGLAAGILVDKFGAKKIILIGIIISVIGAFLRMTAANFGTMLAAMILSGVSATFLNTNAAKILGGWFSKEKISMVMGLYLAASTIGMAVGTGTTALLPNMNTAFLLAACISAFVAIIWMLFMKDPNNVEEMQEVTPIGECFRVVIKSKTVWIVALCLMCIMGCNITVSTFLPSALTSRGIDAVSAGTISTMVTLGSLLGCIFAPLIASKLKHTKALIFILGLTAAVFTLFAWRMPGGMILNICLLVAGAASGGLMPILMSLPICLPEIGPKYAGTAGGFISTIQLLGAVVIPSHIIAPLAKNNELLFIFAGICIGIVCILSVFLPRLEQE